MSKKKILIPLIIFSTILTTCSVYTYQMLYSPNFLINSEDKYIIIEEGTDFNMLIKKLEDDTLINDILSFSFLSKIMEYLISRMCLETIFAQVKTIEKINLAQKRSFSRL